MQSNSIIKIFEQTIKELEGFALFKEEEVKMFQLAFFEIEKLQKNSELFEFIKAFNEITGKKYTATIEIRELYYSSSHEFSYAEKIQSVKNAMTDVWKTGDNVRHVKDFIYPELILKSVAKYLNFVAPTKDVQTMKMDENEYKTVQI